MQKIIVLIAAILSASALFAQKKSDAKMQEQQNVSATLYCATLKEGKIVVLIDDNNMLNEDSLQNGWKIKGDGSITKKDGTKTTLKNGQCIDKRGKITGKTKTEGMLPAYKLREETVAVK